MPLLAGFIVRAESQVDKSAVKETRTACLTCPPLHRWIHHHVHTTTPNPNPGSGFHDDLDHAMVSIAHANVLLTGCNLVRWLPVDASAANASRSRNKPSRGP